jgi:hypothetical protein
MDGLKGSTIMCYYPLQEGKHQIAHLNRLFYVSICQCLLMYIIEHILPNQQDHQVIDLAYRL